MSNVEKMVRMPLYIGQEPLTGSYYAAECKICGWVGSSEVLGIESLEAVKKLCAGDPARLGDIVRRII